MRYAQIRSMDISNGEGTGVALFVQGCPIHCPECFNKETWDFNGGYEWTEEIEEKFMELVKRPYIRRVSILGGEPLAAQNIGTVEHIVYRIITECGPQKSIWVYTGYTFENIRNDNNKDFLYLCNILVDGAYIDDLKDRKLEFRGSTNQRLIDMTKTNVDGEVILYKR